MSGGPGGMIMGKGGPKGAPSGPSSFGRGDANARVSFMGGPDPMMGGPPQGGSGMGAGGFMATSSGKGESAFSGGGMGAGGFMTTSVSGPQSDPTGGFMGAQAQASGYSSGEDQKSPFVGQEFQFGSLGSPGSQMEGRQMQDMKNTYNGIGAKEKRPMWRILFFVGALCVFVAGSLAIFHFVVSFVDVADWSPYTFCSCCFLLVFGLLMIVLDYPVPSKNKQMEQILKNINTFALFMTRFTGRGLWYIFLGTHTWVALYDDSANSFFGIVFTSYLIGLGVAATTKGMLLSKKMHDVQREFRDKRVQPSALMREGALGMNKEEFQQMVTKLMPNGKNMFSDAEYDYIINALNFKPRNDGIVITEELEYWLHQGPMLLV